jgi:hypothetical protein
MLHAHMSGQVPSPSGTLPGDIRLVLAAKQRYNHKKDSSVKINEASTNPEILTVGYCTYFLNKGETITFQGNQYFTHSYLFGIVLGNTNSPLSIWL